MSLLEDGVAVFCGSFIKYYRGSGLELYLLTVLTVVSAFGLAVGRVGETFAGFRLFTQEFNASKDELPNDFG